MSANKFLLPSLGMNVHYLGQRKKVGTGVRKKYIQEVPQYRKQLKQTEPLLLTPGRTFGLSLLNIFGCMQMLSGDQPPFAFSTAPLTDIAYGLCLSRNSGRVFRAFLASIIVEYSP
jgi:hypothetical protein